jgi:L-lactate utilization protein LutC
MSRDTFLARVRQAAAAGRAYRVGAAGEMADHGGYGGADADPAARFADEVKAAGGFASLVDTLDEARLRLSEILRESACQSALCWRHPLLDRLRLAELLDAHAMARHDHDSLSRCSPDQARAFMLAADVGISSVDYAIAETGTLALASAPGRERSTSLLPPLHVAIVDSAQIVPDLFDFFERLDPGDGSAPALASNWTLITGPSKTGDLELTLTTGVHGPGRLHVLIVRDSSPAPA